MSCARAKINICAVEGETLTRDFIWKAGTPPVGVDLTDFTGVCQVRTSVSSATPVFELTQANGGFVFADQSITPGGYSLKIAASETEGMCSSGMPVVLVYDLIFKDANDKVRVLQYGTLSIAPAITRTWEA